MAAISKGSSLPSSPADSTVSGYVQLRVEALAKIVDFVAALSCEAVGGYTADFGAINTAHEFIVNDADSVAIDMKFLLSGSNQVGKLESEAIARIPEVHGQLRKVVKAVRSCVRMELNSDLEYVEEVLGNTKLPLLLILRDVGKDSLIRTKMNLRCDGVSKCLVSLFEVEGCPSEESLRSGYKLTSDSLLEEDYVKFVNELKKLFETVWNIMVWEAITAYAALEGDKANEALVKIDEKAEEEEKKVVLGKGTNLIVQFIGDMIRVKGVGTSEGAGLLEGWVACIKLVLDLREPEFDKVLGKVQEIIESNESRARPKLPMGTRDIFNEQEVAVRDRLFSIVSELRKKHGVMSLDTPAFELRDTIRGIYGQDFEFICDLDDQGGELLSLRYDLTVSFATHMVMKGLTSLKGCQIAKVYKRGNQSKERCREFYQCNFDIAGQYVNMGPDFEVIKILTELLDESDIGEYEVKLNHCMLLEGMLEICGVPPEKFRTISSSIDKLDKQSFEQIKKEIVEQKGLSEETADKIGMFAKERGKPKELLSKLNQEGSKFLENKSSISALKDLEILFECLEKSNCIDKVTFDLSLARSHDYYTGVIFEAVFKGANQVVLIATGGRYDNLIGKLGTKQIPAVGFSLALERVSTIMQQHQQDRDKQSLNSDLIDYSDSWLPKEEYEVTEKSPASLRGGCPLVHKVAALATSVDLVAALSCEAFGGEIACFGATDTGDGFVDKEAASVARDMKVLLNGSKLVGKVKSDAISRIPKVHGRLREVVKSLHSSVRDLNSVVKPLASAVAITMSPLLLVLRDAGNDSLVRSKMNLSCAGMHECAVSLFEERRSKECLRSGYKLVSESLLEEEYGKFVNELNELLKTVWNIMVWEAITAYIVFTNKKIVKLELDENVKKEEKKKVVLGKGTNCMVQLIQEMIKVKGVGVDKDLGLLDSCQTRIVSVFNYGDPEFDVFLRKAKYIVESNESRRLPKPPKGTRIFSKEQMVVRERAFSLISEGFKRCDAVALDTPIYELRDTLMGKYGEDSKLIFDLADKDGEQSSLRYDLTVPFARFLAMNDITFFKRYQIGKVYRRDNPSKGRYREFYQCDFDIAGPYEKMGPDSEVIKVLTERLDELDIGEYEIKLNHRMLLDGMLEICGVPPEKFRTICSSVDKLDKQSFEQIKKEMVERKGISVDTADRIGMYAKERGRPLELLSKLKQEGSKFLENNSSTSALKDLEILFEDLEKSNCIDKVTFDLSLARGLDYYTGVIFEAAFKGETQVGSIAAGGRYDNLIGQFGKKQVPAVGLSLGIERVFTIMEQRQKDCNERVRVTEIQVLLSIVGDNLPLAAELVNKLWDAKLNAEFLVSKRFEKHNDYAKEFGIPYIIIVREHELRQGFVKVKNMQVQPSVEKIVPIDNMADEVEKLLSQ